MSRPFLVSIVGAAVLLSARAQVPRDLEQRIRVADREITRLAPSAFPQLPANLAQDLRRRGCSIPQPVFARQPQNVIKGQFARPGQVDWAVLCSVKGRSSILVFWNGSEIKPASIASASDDQFIQGIGEGKFGFSRAIGTVGRTYILAHAAVVGQTVRSLRRSITRGSTTRSSKKRPWFGISTAEDGWS